MPERYLGRSLGKYRVEALLGTGGFAWVYRAHDSDLDIDVALKILRPQFAGDPAFVERFRREASTAARLRHPNVITIYNVGEEDDAVYFAMDYLPQGLQGRLQVTPALPGPVLAGLAIDVASALGFAHRQGVVHRDIKPDNILFDEHGNAVVADFGIARALTGNTQETATQMVVGTPHYFAPEQARGRTLDGRADLYSLGVTLYRAASGTLPFPGDDWYEVARAHVEREPPDVRAAGAAISPGMAAVIHRLMEKDPADRFQDADELKAALQALPERHQPETVRTVAVPAIDRLWTSTGMTARRRRLRRRVLLGSAAALAVAAGMAALSTVGRPPAPGPLPADSAGLTTSPTTPPTLAPSVVLAIPAAAVTRERPAQTATLRVVAPEKAQLFVDGRAVGTGSWSTSDLSAGTHRIAAELQTIDGCPTARVEQRVVLVAGGSARVTPSPRPCGRLAILPTVDGAPLSRESGGRYTLTDDSGASSGGQLPLGGPLVLAAGRYELRVGDIAMCTQFTGSVDVPEGATVTPRIFLLCR